MTQADLNFDNTYFDQLEGLYVPIEPTAFPRPELLVLNEGLAESLGLDAAALRAGSAGWFGGRPPEGASPLAQAYAGHQFGGFSPQLGDGRAVLLGELVGPDGQRRDLQLKGSGRTPFSRGGDGRATLGPVLREYLMSEAMHALGVPTTRALAALSTGERVRRQEGPLPGALLVRIADSHLRVGTFQFFAARGDVGKLSRLTGYALARHYPQSAEAEHPALALLRGVAVAQAGLIARWMQLGFIHGVMNTDNCTISGETIDYGPCAFMERYDPATVFSSIDQMGRYAYGNQPGIGGWNLARFAEALLPVLHEDRGRAVELAQEVLNGYGDTYTGLWLDGMRRKLGLSRVDDGDAAMINELLTHLQAQEVDFTSFFRRLSAAARGDPSGCVRLFSDSTVFTDWAAGWEARLDDEGRERGEVGRAMDAVNPMYIPRNHKVEEALNAAIAGEMAPFQQLLAVAQSPFEERPEYSAFADPAPSDFGPHVTYCGT